jgi:hypothetical protein
VVTLAGNLDLFGSSILAGWTAVSFARLHRALAGQVRTLSLFNRRHFSFSLFHISIYENCCRKAQSPYLGIFAADSTNCYAIAFTEGLGNYLKLLAIHSYVPDAVKPRPLIFAQLSESDRSRFTSSAHGATVFGFRSASVWGMITQPPWVVAVEETLRSRVLYLRFIIQPINAPAVTPTANVVATVSARFRWRRCVVSLRNSSAASPPCFAARLTTPTPSAIASAIALVAHEA